MNFWKFGDYKSFTSLKLLTHVLGLPSPKSDIEGSDIYEVYYSERNIDRIRRYCEQDTIAVARVLLRFMDLPALEEQELIFV